MIENGYEEYWFQEIQVESEMLDASEQGGSHVRKGMGMVEYCRSEGDFHTSLHTIPSETAFLPCAGILPALGLPDSADAQALAPSTPSSCALSQDP